MVPVDSSQQGAHNKGLAPLDMQMQRACDALVQQVFHEAERLAASGLDQAHRLRDYDRMGRIALVLQEARRQRVQRAADAGVVCTVNCSSELGSVDSEGACVIQPPLVGLDAAVVRQTALRRGRALIVLVREPMTKAGLWPVVAATESVVVRVMVEPPAGEMVSSEQAAHEPVTELISMNWVMESVRALGDKAIDSIDASMPGAWRVDDLMEALLAVPEHDQLHQVLAAACKDAQHEPEPAQPRRTTKLGNPFSF